MTDTSQALKAARELLAREYERDGLPNLNTLAGPTLNRALRAILAARAEAFERAAGIAREAAAEAERVGKLHPEGSDSRERMFARSREASAIEIAIRKEIEHG